MIVTRLTSQLMTVSNRLWTRANLRIVPGPGKGGFNPAPRARFFNRARPFQINGAPLPARSVMSFEAPIPSVPAVWYRHPWFRQWGGYVLAALGAFLFASKGIWIKFAYHYHTDASSLPDPAPGLGNAVLRLGRGADLVAGPQIGGITFADRRRRTFGCI